MCNLFSFQISISIHKFCAVHSLHKINCVTYLIYNLNVFSTGCSVQLSPYKLKVGHSTLLYSHTQTITADV